MERLLSPCDREYMKMAMLKHEETFKKQVHELHRLYRVQKILMKSIDSRRPNGEKQLEVGSWNPKNGISPNEVGSGDAEQRPRPTLLDLELPAEDYIAETEGGALLEIENESEIELTLGPASYYRRKKVQTASYHSGWSFSSSSTGSTSQTKRTSTSTAASLATQPGIDGLSTQNLTGLKWGLMEGPDSNPGFQIGRSRNSFDLEEQLRQDRLKQPPWLFQVLSLNMT